MQIKFFDSRHRPLKSIYDLLVASDQLGPNAIWAGQLELAVVANVFHNGV